MITADLKRWIENQFPKSSQLITVQDDGVFFQALSLYAFEKMTGQWQKTFGPMRILIGRNGFAPPDEKQEGDGRTPTGVYPLGLIFGYESVVPTKMTYRRMTTKDIWVDDPSSPDYNRLVEKGKTTARSFEEMILADKRYKYGIVVEYNTNPIVSGKGSAIFLHVQKDEKTPTSGCVALFEEDILKIIDWLDPYKVPIISLGDAF